MKNRIPNPAPAQRATFGLIAWLEQTRIVLPLKGVECAFHVCGDVVSVEIDQIFHQDNSRPLDCLYTFPLPASAAVYRCEMHVNGRMIRARVEEREQARQLAREKKVAGFRTTLVEMDRDNLFTLSLGNVQPGDVVVIRFAYFETLTRLGDWTSFHIPFCPGIRYIPGTPLLRANQGRGTADDTDQVPDASRISPPRMDRLHRDAAYLSVEGTMEHLLDDVKDISSPSHPVFVKFGQHVSHITIADRATVPDCDFVLRWTELQPAETKPTGWLASSNNGTFALLRLRAPANVAPSDDYAQDVYFLIDRSGSMQGLKWQKAAEAFRAFLQNLGKNDRAWATFFESQFRDLAEKPLPTQSLLADPTVQNLEALGARGGTELMPALGHVLEKIAVHSPDRPVSLVLITDGQIGNEFAVLQRLTRYSSLRVNVFGIDVALNDGFLKKLAAQHNGASCLLSPQDDIVGAVARLGSRLRRPVLTSIRVPEGWELAGKTLPDLFEGEVLSLPLKAAAKADFASAKSILISAKLPGGQTHALEFNLTATDAPAILLLWARRRIDYLLAQNQAAEAIALAKQTNIVCEGAAFIAWDETEKVPVSRPEDELYQPALLTKQLAEARPGRGIVAGTFAAGSFSAGKVAESSEALYDADIFFSHKPRGFFRRFRSGSQGAHKVTPLTALEQLRRLRPIFDADPLFKERAGVKFLDHLFAWATLDQTHVQLIGQLLALLQQTAKRPVPERFDALRKWIEQTIPEPLSAPVLNLLAQIENEARARLADHGIVGQTKSG